MLADGVELVASNDRFSKQITKSTTDTKSRCTSVSFRNVVRRRDVASVGGESLQRFTHFRPFAQFGTFAKPYLCVHVDGVV